MTTTLWRAPAADAGLLRTSLRLDGWGTAAFGVFLLAAAPVLDGPLGLPIGWSRPIGVVMLAGAAALLLIARGRVITQRSALGVVAVNALSAPAMVALTCTDLMPLTGWGKAFLYAGALYVATFATIEYAGMRRENR
ncbi:hypothetical protein [Nocardia huaxiensis]|uniref:hypothetical protein n=1 Tax=Nocardia huaxiensis TaxID=2755382 RepID=UPI001E361678|nr:hypothetical protein [Nocardia huaxiensis]UFS97342.1 hypothetical protein LPY97_05340 [Nocardia huaxiensis]